MINRDKAYITESSFLNRILIIIIISETHFNYCLIKFILNNKEDLKFIFYFFRSFSFYFLKLFEKFEVECKFNKILNG